MKTLKPIPIAIAFLLGVFTILSVRNYQIQSTQKELLRLQIIQLKQDLELQKLEKEVLIKYKQEADSE